MRELLRNIDLRKFDRFDIPKTVRHGLMMIAGLPPAAKKLAHAVQNGKALMVGKRAIKMHGIEPKDQHRKIAWDKSRWFTLEELEDLFGQRAPDELSLREELEPLGVKFKTVSDDKGLLQDGVTFPPLWKMRQKMKVHWGIDIRALVPAAERDDPFL